ncbi:hypothetical protein BKA65DRAFT_527718 [Rhexocercosporidium sp. MPI-PUGE-AT-0058]|nr:hypothetical protein BKA65DRAFT_527718 [Rhexocercosporidium sp. MPI-PUGE-AT-0058]
MGPSDNRRNTEIDMLAVFEAKAPNHVFERAGSFDSPGSTPRAAPSQKTAQSRTAKSATSGPLQLRTAWESPWEKYEKFYDVELGGPVEVAIRKAAPVELVHVRAFVTQAAEKTLHVYRQLQHPNIPLSLEPIVRSPAYPDARQLAAILGQIITGVAYLAAEGFEHGSLTCSNILLNTDGDVKIANQECCHVKSDGRPRDIRALSSITMELMQKYVKEDGAVGVDDLHRWPSNSDAVGFLSATTSTASAAELLEHPLLSRPHHKESLIGLVSLAQICMRGRYKYTRKE